MVFSQALSFQLQKTRAVCQYALLVDPLRSWG